MKDTLTTEGLFAEVDADCSAAAQDRVARALLTHAGTPTWRVATALPDPDAPRRWGVEVAYRGPPLAAADAWQLAHTLSETLDGPVEPLFAGEVELPAGYDPLESLLEAPAPRDDWHATMVCAAEAWATFPPGVTPGDGVRVGHPDTGYTRHPELGDPPAHERALTQGLNLVEPGTPPLDPLERGFGEFGGHGTATGGVIVSPDSVPAPGLEVVGLAPGAALVPFRVSDTVVTFGWTKRLAMAIEEAVDRGCHVISMSLGGLPSRRLHRAVRYARSCGVIVIAAAGNVVQLVVWPAAYDETIACAACGPDSQPWAGSSKGPAVDVTAPGHRVRVAGWNGTHPTTRLSSGTSFATAVVAATAALWLSKHGIEELRRRYTDGLLPRAFEAVLRSTCVPTPTGVWPRSWFGAGRVRADRVLDRALPDAAHLTSDQETLAPAPRDALANLLAAVPTGNESIATPQIAQLSQGLRNELAFHLARGPELLAAFTEGRTHEAPPPYSPALSSALAPSSSSLVRDG